MSPFPLTLPAPRKEACGPSVISVPEQIVAREMTQHFPPNSPELLTLRAHAESHLPPSTELTLAALNHLPSAVLVVDEQDRVVQSNRAANALFGEREDVLKYPPLDTFLRKTENECAGAASELPRLPLERIEKGEQVCELQLTDGSCTTGSFTSRALTVAGKKYLVLCIRETSQLLKLQEERNRLLRIATIGEALPSLLHELKNPLAAISVATEVLLEETESPDIREQLHAILSEIRRMKLSFDGIGALERPLCAERPQAVDFACREAGTVMVHRAANAGQYLRLRISDMPLLRLDSGVVRALILNFVTNSIQACRTGDTITVNAWHDDSTNRFELRVVDTGKGMAPETLRRVTELFFSTKSSGSGIGLALCKRVIEDAGGKLSIDSVLGFGTAVDVTVPCG